MTRPSGARWSSVGTTSACHCLFGRLEDGGQAVGGRLVGAEDAEVALLGVELDHVAEELAQVRASSFMTLPGSGHVDRVVAEIGQPQVAEQDAAVGVRVGPHPALALGGQLAQLGDEPAALVEQLLGPVAPHPGFEELEVLGVLGRLGERHLVGPVGPLDRQAVDHLGAGPALGRLEDDHRPARPLGDAPLAGVGLDAPDLGDDLVERLGHELVHRLRLVPLDEVGRVAVAAQELLQLLAADPGQDGRVGDLVAVQVEDRQHGAVVRRVEELVAVPARGQRAGLGLAVADDAGDDQIGVVERGPEGVAEAVAQLAPFVDRARRLRRDVAGNAARGTRTA